MDVAHDPTDDRPTLAQLKAVVQPPEHIARYNAEHWAGALYLRHLSIHLTRLLLPTGISANGVTTLMIVIGLGGAVALLIPGLVGAVVCVVAMQLQILFDCSDGEVARWRQRFSPTGIYLDRIGHYVTEAAIPVFLGMRAGGWDWSNPRRVDGWTAVGLLVAVLVLLNKSFTDLMHVARAKSGRPVLADVVDTARPKSSGMARLRSSLAYLPFFRAFIAIEASLLVLVAAVVDAVHGDLVGSRFLVVVMVPLAVVTALGHLAAVLASSRLD
ncbi:CDP-alcohol phosphatidyltransferase family protein [Terracoccus luteus]|uniref:Phosphatidylserine synthase n=1 Tax=Terracoccus luteus TaxID=53356 RepID=A0A839PYI8_9MICO|nr:CDP-alcohol phosphatidyltransferase family protein [Terracoccus luteus]MBB2985461.1 phosphatidylserine synthase [Terracoccus luteus]MCP2171113.1 phosphatidylserine synthase [Terracoccus luteus]